MYAVKNYKSQAELVKDFKAGVKIQVFQPGPFGHYVKDGKAVIEGPHYPEPHKFYIPVEIVNGVITRIIKG